MLAVQIEHGQPQLCAFRICLGTTSLPLLDMTRFVMGFSRMTPSVSKEWEVQSWFTLPNIGATNVGTGGYWSSRTFRLGTNNVLVPNFLAVVFKKQEISQQVWLLQPTNKHSSHQNAGFSIWVLKKFPGVIPPDPHSARGWRDDLLQHPPWARPLAAREAHAPRCWDANLGPPQLFSRGCAECAYVCMYPALQAKRWDVET